MIVALLTAGEVAQGGDGAAEAAERLRAAADLPDVPRRYPRSGAACAPEMLAPSDPDNRAAGAGAMAEPGAPYAALAEEQLALLDIREGDLEAGLDRLRSLERSAAATPGLQQRASQLIVAFEAGVAADRHGPVRGADAGPADRARGSGSRAGCGARATTQRGRPRSRPPADDN